MRRLFSVFATDHPGVLAARQAARERHRARLRDPAPHAIRVILAGPTFDSADGVMNGTLLIVEGPSAEAVRRFVDEDPYVAAGVYARVEIRPWRCGIGPAEFLDGGVP